MSKPVFAYWDVRGLANPSRHLLHYIGLDYEEKFYALGKEAVTARDDWVADKHSLGLTFPNLPYWIEKDTGFKLTESKAILKHIARKHAPELMPKSLEEFGEADMLENLLVDIQTQLVFAAYYYTDEAGAQMEQRTGERLEYLNKHLSGKKWINGQELSYLDFLLYDVLYFFKSYKAAMLDPHSNLKSHMSTFEAIPAIAKYMASSKYIKGPCLAPFAKKAF